MLRVGRVFSVRSFHIQNNTSFCWRNKELQHTVPYYFWISTYWLYFNNCWIIPCSFPRFLGHTAGVSPSGSPLPHLPSLHLSYLLCHLRAHCSVRTSQCGRGRPHEAPGGQQQGGPAGGDGGESRDETEGGGQPTPHCGICGWRLGVKHGSTCASNEKVTFLDVWVGLRMEWWQWWQQWWYHVAGAVWRWGVFPWQPAEHGTHAVSPQRQLPSTTQMLSLSSHWPWGLCRLQLLR